MPTPDKTVVGCTGHQDLSKTTKAIIRTALKTQLGGLRPLVGVSSLAAGADQLFAECVLELDGDLFVVIPSQLYEDTFESHEDLDNYRRLLCRATRSIKLNQDKPSETAFWDAGKNIVDQCDILIAVWDGEPAGGLGGTADVVRYAQKQERRVIVVWPDGASRS